VLNDQAHLVVKLAECQAEIEAAQRLRYRVFVEEMGAAAGDQSRNLGLEQDRFDPFFDHLLLIDNRIEEPEHNVVGVYRLLTDQKAQAGIGFYGADEYDLSPILNSGKRSVELGRSCIDRAYRGGAALQMLWDGVADYVMARNIEVLFGVASFHGTDPAPVAQALSFLHHIHLAPPELRAKAKPDHALDMAIVSRDQVHRPTAVKQLPQLIKSYLRLGGWVGQDAYIDHDFNTIDVCIVMDTSKLSDKYAARYLRRGGV
jgi:putative hemolysin